jgi:hypothetical protein
MIPGTGDSKRSSDALRSSYIGALIPGSIDLKRPPDVGSMYYDGRWAPRIAGLAMRR